MYNLHAFMVINALVDNTYSNVSPLGELSKKSLSYAKDIMVYTDEDYDDVRLMVFNTKQDETIEPLSTKLAKEVLALGDWLTKQSLLNRFNENKATFTQHLRAEYSTRINLLETGKMIQSGNYYLPEYITFSLNSDKRENRYKIWFADKAFQYQYDKYDIEVVPQIENIDDLHKGADKVREVLLRNTLSALHNRVNQTANGLPYTYIITNKYDYINPLDENDIQPINFTVIIYGESGNNLDIIRNAISDWVLKNSDYSRDEWEKIIPDLFTPTEFYLCPMWHKFATENLQMMGGIYSPVMTYREIIPFAKRVMIGFDEDHLRNYLVAFNSIFKSISVLACGHKKNRLAPKEFELTWPDYCNIYTTSRDFNRISPQTQEFILFMNKLFFEAETMTPEVEVPSGMSRIQREDIWYLTSTFNDVVYLVPLRWNFLREIQLDGASVIHIPIVNPEGDTSNDRIDNIINMTPNLGKPPTPGRQRGQPVITRTEGDGDNTVVDSISVDRHAPRTDGLEGTPVDRTDGTPTAEGTGTPPTLERN